MIWLAYLAVLWVVGVAGYLWWDLKNYIENVFDVAQYAVSYTNRLNHRDGELAASIDNLERRVSDEAEKSKRVEEYLDKKITALESQPLAVTVVKDMVGAAKELPGRSARPLVASGHGSSVQNPANKRSTPAPGKQSKRRRK